MAAARMRTGFIALQVWCTLSSRSDRHEHSVSLIGALVGSHHGFRGGRRRGQGALLWHTGMESTIEPVLGRRGRGDFEKKPVLILDFSQPPAAATGRNFCT